MESANLSILLWILAAAGLGFSTAWFFSALLHLSRKKYLLPYLAVTALFCAAFFIQNAVDLKELFAHNWGWGLVGAAVTGVFVVRNILSQPASPRAAGWPLAFDLLWSGVLYGALDALLLSVVPVLSVWILFTRLGWAASWAGLLMGGLAAILASILVTAAYHLGYPEYRNRKLLAPVFGNTVFSLGYILTGNPLAALVSHAAMHIAAVLHGPATTLQLPPHE